MESNTLYPQPDSLTPIVYNIS